MRYCSLIIAYALMYSNWSWCQKMSLDTARHSYFGNFTQNNCPKGENEVINPRNVNKVANLHKGYENDMVELIKRKFTSMAGSKLKYDVRRDEAQDDPNLIQALMSRAFIDNANYVFHKNDIKDEDSGTFLIGKHVFQVNKYPKVKADLERPFSSCSRGKRDILVDKTDSDDFDDPEETANEKKEKSKDSDESEMRIHCVRAGPSEVLCKHDNYTFSFKLPTELFDRKVMENLVSSVCSIVEEAAPEGTGKVEISVKKSNQAKNKEGKGKISSKSEHKEDPERVVNKVIRINIPIDFSAIPLGIEEDDKLLNDKSEKESLTEVKRMRDDSPLIEKQPNKSFKRIKYHQTKIDDSYSSDTDQGADNDNSLSLAKSNDCNYNPSKDENQEKWLNKRDNLQTPMVFPPSLILFKRSPDTLNEQQNVERSKRNIYNFTSYDETMNNERFSSKQRNELNQSKIN